MHAADQELLAQLASRLPADFGRSKRVIVAVSGGSDSLALIHLLRLWRSREMGPAETTDLELIAFHFDHGWHEQSTEIARWVRHELARVEIPTIIRRRTDVAPRPFESWDPVLPPPAAPSSGPQSEAVARSLRYAALADVARQLSAPWALTGHTRDDQVETVLMRIARGTGLSGLAGIPARRALNSDCQLLRPLLSATRAQLRDFLERSGCSFQEDPTNADPGWTRNKVRRSVLPWLRENFSPQLDNSLLGLAALADDYQVVVGSLATAYQEALIDQAETGLTVAIQPLSGLSEPAVRSLLHYWWSQARLPEQEMSQAHWRKLTALVVRPPTRPGLTRPWPSQVHLPGHWVAKRSRGRLQIEQHRD